MCMPLAAGVSAAAAQEATTDSFIQQQRLLNEKIHEEQARIAPLNSKVDFQFGGWFDYYLFHLQDGVQRSRVYQRPGFSPWARLSLDNGGHEFFARMRLTYDYFNQGDEFERRQDWVGPNFDRAWYQIDGNRAFHLDAESPLQLKARIGRQPVTFGTGYAFDMPVDAVLLEARMKALRVRGLVARTIASYPNVDRSPAVDNHQNRRFYGVETTYTGFSRHEPFAYVLWNQDHTDERHQEWRQEYSYDTTYIGFGSRGSLMERLSYWNEWVFETGHSFGDGNYIRQDYVEAWGFDIGLEYLFEGEWKPRASLEYMFAGGDSDRLGSPTGALGGNRNGREDTSFVGFGYRDTGIVAAPTLSNVHVWRLGGSLQPFPRSELLRDFEIGSNWFLIHKNRRTAAISDFSADRGSGFVGGEMDYFVNWRLGSDLSWTLRWGVFFPGEAYRDREARQTIFTGLTWSF